MRLSRELNKVALQFGMVGCEVKLMLMYVATTYTYRDVCTWQSLSSVHFLGLCTSHLTVFCLGSLSMKIATIMRLHDQRSLEDTSSQQCYGHRKH